MSRTMPSECPHGAIYDWGGFGDDDGEPERCEHGCNAGLPGEQRNDEQAWRVGQHYGIHAYEGDRPVATFHTSEDAAAAVEAHNTLAAVRVELQAARDEAAQLRATVLRMGRLTDDRTEAAREDLAAARRTLDEQRSAIDRYRDHVAVFCPSIRNGDYSDVCALPDEHDGPCWFDAASSSDTETRDERGRAVLQCRTCLTTFEMRVGDPLSTLGGWSFDSDNGWRCEQHPAVHETRDEPRGANPCGDLEPGCRDWPDAQPCEYNPACCRFPKSCSANRCDRPSGHAGDHTDHSMPEGHAGRSWNDDGDYTGAVPETRDEETQ